MTTTFGNSLHRIFALLFCLISLPIAAQTIRGTIRDAENMEPVVGATVAIRFLRGQTPPISMASNPEGDFRFEKIRPGYYSLSINAQGFENQIITELIVSAGKEQVLEINLRRTLERLEEVTISANLPNRPPLQVLGEIPLTRDQTQRFPATFFDPARLATAYPGVVQTDDGTNSLSIRGNNPAFVRWRLEGVEIINPNHLSNAGTFSDRPAAASGGISMFSAQLLDNSSLLTGPMPASYGDAISGLMDMHLRKGNQQKHEFTAQVGLIGLDVAAEGPIGKKGKNAYLANYRYSTVGLLGELGVSFGDEQINFQDFAFNLSFEGNKTAKWTVFGMGGLSKNIFRHKTDTTEIRTQKDYFDVDYRSETKVIGATFSTQTGKRSLMKTSLAYSEQTNFREQTSPTFPDYRELDDLFESKLSGSTSLAVYITSRVEFSTGMQGQISKFSQKEVLGSPNFQIPALESLLFQPWMQLQWRSRNRKNLTSLGLNYIANLAFTYRSYSGINYQPRFNFTRKVAPKQTFSVALGTYSQASPWWLNPRNFFNISNNNSITSQKFELGYRVIIAPNWQINAAAYRQWLGNVPYFANEGFSQINSSEFSANLNLSNVRYTNGQNDGVEISLEKTVSDGWYLLSSVSFIDSRYTRSGSNAPEEWLSTRWDIGHVVNTTVGKEWQREKSPGHERTVGMNARTVWSGGLREADIALQNDVPFNTINITDPNGYSRQARDYFRLDFRVYWRKNLGGRRTSTFSLDLQNLTGQQNLAHRFFNGYTNRFENKFQLGTIPNFTWRLEW